MTIAPAIEPAIKCFRLAPWKDESEGDPSDRPLYVLEALVEDKWIVATTDDEPIVFYTFAAAAHGLHLIASSYGATS